MDKLSDELLVKILSFLPTKVAVSTSVLSKRWQFLWMLSPKLHYVVTHRTVWDFINKNMPLHRAPNIESLCLEIQCYLKPQDIRLLVEIAVSFNVRELDIDYNYHSYLGNLETLFPSSFYTCESLVVLKLRDMTLMDIPSSGCLHSLKTLQLLIVRYADSEVFQQLLSFCPVLEDLDVHFHFDDIVKRFTVIVPSLQKLSLYIPGELYIDGYEIDTPSLKYLRLEGYRHCDITLFRDMPKLREAYVDVVSLDLKSIIGSITSVKHLTICSQDVYGDGFVFNQLEHLTLCVCKSDSSNLLARLLKDSPNLRVLDISLFRYHRANTECNDIVFWNEPSDVPECLLSSLQIFNWARYFGRPEDKDIAVYILKNARHLRKATIQADTKVHNVSNLKMIKELTLSPRASSTCELVFVDDIRA